VVDHLETQFINQDIGLAYVYLDYKDHLRQSPLNIATSLLRQLALRVNRAIPEVTSMYWSFYARGRQPDMATILNVLKSVTTMFTSVFVLIDALDECEKESRQVLLDILNEFAACKINLLVTSRPHLREVRHAFKDAPKIEIVADLNDVKRFMEKKVEQQITQSVGLKKKIVDTLSVTAQGM
jgi:hypothetical protein